MTATKLEEEALVAHAAECLRAETALVERRCSNRREKRPGFGATSLNDLLHSVRHALLKRLMPPPHCWQTAELIGIMDDICSGAIKLERNGRPRDKLLAKRALFGLTRSEDGSTLLASYDELCVYLILPELLLGLLIRVATVVAFERALAHAYDLRPLEVQILVMCNGQLRDEVDRPLAELVAHNLGAWYREYSVALRRFDHPMSEAALTNFPFTQNEVCTDLAPYCPTGAHAGERIDLARLLQRFPLPQVRLPPLPVTT